MAPAPFGTLEGEVFQVIVVTLELVRNREVGKLRLAKLDGDVGSFGNPEGVVARLRQFVEERSHLGGRLQVVLVAVELETVGVRHE